MSVDSIELPPSIAALPGGSATWVLARRRLPVYVMEPAPHPADVVICFELETMRVVHHEICGEDDEATFERCLIVAMSDPAFGFPRLPAALRVESKKLYKRFKKGLKRHGVRVEVGEAEGVDPILEGLASSHFAAVEDRSYLSKEVEPADVGRLFEASTRLWAQAPWSGVEGPLVFAVELHALGLKKATVVLLGDGEPGLMVFARVKHFVRFWRRATAPASSLVSEPGVELMALYYASEREIGEKRATEARRHGWVHPSGVYPEVVHVDPEREQWELQSRTYPVLAACCGAVTGFLVDQPKALKNPKKQRSSMVVPRDWPDVGAVEVRYPHERWKVKKKYESAGGHHRITP